MGIVMQTLDRGWQRAMKRVVVAHMALARSDRPSDRKAAQRKCDLTLADYRIATGKKRDRVLREPLHDNRPEDDC